MLIARAAIVVLLLAGSHAMPVEAADRVYPVIELTDQEAALIDVTDGSIEDWRWVVGEPTLTAADFATTSQRWLIPYYWGLPDQDEGLHDPHDLDFRMWLAWHRSTARIYVAMERADDVWVNEFDRGNRNLLRYYMVHHDGAIVIAVDADQSGEPIYVDGTHAGENYWGMLLRETRQAQFYYVLPQVYDSGRHVQIYNESVLDLHSGARKEWLLNPPYADGGGSVWGESPTMSVTEAYVTAFDGLIWHSPTESVVSPLSPGKVIGLFIDVPDRDDRHYEAFVHHHLGRVSTSYATDTFIDALLLGPRADTADAPPMESIAWSRIKATFAR